MMAGCPLERISSASTDGKDAALIEPPSKKLVDRLVSLNLCRPADLRRCRRRVKRLARDLPAFDCVWIDALLQDRRLTPFQAKRLEMPQPASLAIGPCVLLDQLGSGPNATTYAAQHRESGEKCVLKVLHALLNDSKAVEYKLQEVIDRVGPLESPFIIPPKSVGLEEGRLVIISRFLEGIPLTDLLIRRGRFPPAIVREIARQLIAGLASLETCAVVHGDVTLGNARLTPSGTVVLTDAGLMPVIQPEVLIRPDVAPERYNGTAPERIATGSPATVASDMYAVGCLLWQLLTGRPPFPTGDPLAKLAQHQTRSIVDVREWAPDTPDDLVAMLNRMTAFSPDDRPAAFSELTAVWGTPRSARSRTLRKFVAAFRQSAPRLTLNRRITSGFRRLSIILGASLGLLFAFGVMQYGFRDLWESAKSRAAESITALTSFQSLDQEDPAPTSDRTDETVGSPAGSLSLPNPNSDGVIQLESKSYVWNRGQLRSQQTLTIRGPDGAGAIIDLTSPCRIVAHMVILQNVELRSSPDRTQDGQAAAASLVVESNRLIVRGCRFTDGQRPDSKKPFAPDLSGETRPAIHWLGRATSGGSSAQLQNTVFASIGTAIRCDGQPSLLHCENLLYLGRGALCELKKPPENGRTLQVRLQNTTLRSASAFLAIGLPVGQRESGRILVDARDCVFDVTTADAALFRFRHEFPGQLPAQLVHFSGEGCLIPPGTRIESEGTGHPTGVSEREPVAVRIDGGLIAGPFAFAGPFSLRVSDSVIVEHRAPRRSERPPGITPDVLTPP